MELALRADIRTCSFRLAVIVLAFLAALTVIAALPGTSYGSINRCDLMNAADRFGIDCTDTESVPKRLRGADGTMTAPAFDVLTPRGVAGPDAALGACAYNNTDTSVSVSGHGAFVAFSTSYSLTAVPGNDNAQIDPTNCFADIYVRSLVPVFTSEGVKYPLRIASVDEQGHRIPDGVFTKPSISSNGRYVCFSGSTGGVARAVYRKDMVTGNLDHVDFGVNGECSVANNGWVSLRYLKWGIGQFAYVYRPLGNDTSEALYSMSYVQGSPNGVHLSPRALSADGTRFIHLLNAPYSGSQVEVRFSEASSGNVSHTTRSIPNFERVATTPARYASLGHDAVWLTNNWAWNTTTDLVRYDAAEDDEYGNPTRWKFADSDGWHPKLDPATSAGPNWVYRGGDGSSVSDHTIWLSTVEHADDDHYSTGTALSCPVGTNAGGAYAGSGEFGAPDISGDGTTVAYQSDRNVLEGYIGPNRYSVYVRFAYDYEDDCVSDEDMDSVIDGDDGSSEEAKVAARWRRIAAKFSPYMYYDKLEHFYSSRLGMFETSRNGGAPARVRRCPHKEKLFSFWKVCGYLPVVADIDTVVPDVQFINDPNQFPTSDPDFFLDLPGPAEDQTAQRANFARHFQAFGPQDAAYYRIVHVDQLTYIQYWTPYYFSDNRQGDQWGIDGFHEGDWEMVQLVFVGANARTPKWLGYSSHESGEWLNWKTYQRMGGIFIPTRSRRERHPMVFPGRGSHGAFFETGMHGGEPHNGVPLFADYHTSCGRPTGKSTLRTGACRTVVPRLIEIDGNEHWLGFVGNWGELPAISIDDAVVLAAAASSCIGQVSPFIVPICIRQAVPMAGSIRNVGGPTGPARQIEKWHSPHTWQASLQLALTKRNPWRQSQRAHSPVNLGYVAPDGRRVGVINGFQYEEIEDATFTDDEESDVKQVMMPDGFDRDRGGEWLFEGTGNGLWTQVWELPDGESGVSNRFEFKDIQVTAQLRGKAVVAGSGTPVIQLDNDGDGQIDESRAPDTIETVSIDRTDPGAADDLRIASIGNDSIGLSWSTAGDDGDHGVASNYEILYDTEPITAENADDAHTIFDSTETGASQSATVASLDFEQRYYLAVRAGDDVGRTGGISNVVSATTGAAANLVASLVAAPETVLQGSPLTFTATVENNGNAPAEEVVAHFQPPSGFAVSSASVTGGTCDGTTLIDCTVGSLGAGEAAQVTIVGSPMTAGTSEANLSVESDPADADLSDNFASASATVTPAADISVEQSVSPSPAYVGDEVTYALVVTNNGPAGASGVTVTDTPPEGSTVLSADAAGGICEVAAAVTCQLPDLAAGESIVVNLGVRFDEAGDSTNTASAISSLADADDSNNTTALASSVVAMAELSIAKQASASSLLYGGEVDFDLNVTNNGPSPATDVSVVDALPAGMTLLSVSSSEATCVAGPPVECTIESLPSGASATVHLVASILTLGDVENDATVSSTVYDPDPANNAASATVTAVPIADVGVTASSPTTAYAGDVIEQTFTVENHGPLTSDDVALSGALPAGQTVIGVVTDAGSCSAGDSLQCTFGSLASGEARHVTLTLRVDQAGASETVVSLTSATADPDIQNNHASAATDVTAVADLDLMASVLPASLLYGDTATYTLTVVNRGPSAASAITVSNPLPLGLTYVSATSSAGTCGGGAVVTCDVDVLPAGSSAVITVTGTALGLGSMTSVASVGSATFDPNSDNNTASVHSTVEAWTNLSLVATPASVSDYRFGTVDTVFTLTNNGPLGAPNATVTVPIPFGFNYVSASSTTGTCSKPGSVVCAIGTVAPGSQVQITVRLQPWDTGVTTMQAQVSSSLYEPVTADNNANLSLTIRPATCRLFGFMSMCQSPNFMWDIVY